MKNTFEFRLIKPAKNLGGDRYVTILSNKEWTVYFPQELTRPINVPVQTLTISVKVEKEKE